jgi:hypothetical protein
MRRTCLVLIGLAFVARSNARAGEARTEVVMGREFAYASGFAETEFFDGKLALAGGVTMISDFTIERYGAQASIEYRSERFSIGVDAEFSPRQWQRSWATLDPHAELSLEVGSWVLRSDGGVLLREIEAQRRRAVVGIRQLQIHAQLEAEYDERWKLGLFALYSFYDPDLRHPSLRGVDLGVAVTLAGKPEQWAAGGRLQWTIRSRFSVEAMIAAVAYADDSGLAIVPGLAIGTGPWKRVRARLSVDLAVDLSDASQQQLHPIGSLELAYAR